MRKESSSISLSMEIAAFASFASIAEEICKLPRTIDIAQRKGIAEKIQMQKMSAGVEFLQNDVKSDIDDMMMMMMMVMMMMEVMMITMLLLLLEEQENGGGVVMMMVIFHD